MLNPVTVSPKVDLQGPYLNEVLPTEILTHLFNLILKETFGNQSKNWFSPAMVCRQWRKSFQNTFIMCLRNNNFSLHMNSCHLADFVPERVKLATLNQRIGRGDTLWMEKWMEDPSNTKNKIDFILENMWFSCFRTHLKTPHAAIQAKLKLLQTQGIMMYQPDRTLRTCVAEFFNDMPSSVIKKTSLFGISFLQEQRDKTFSADFYFAIVQQDGEALEYVPKNLKIEEMCLAAVKQNGMSLKYVPKDLQTEEMCLIAVEQNGNALRYVPENRRTESISLASVKQKGWVLEFVPKHLLTKEICLTAVQHYGEAFELVPEHLQTEEMCLAAVQHDGSLLKYVRQDLRAKAICLAAVQQNGWALRYVPSLLRTIELCSVAFKQDKAIPEFFFPKHLRTKELCDAFGLEFIEPENSEANSGYLNQLSNKIEGFFNMFWRAN